MQGGGRRTDGAKARGASGQPAAVPNLARCSACLSFAQWLGGAARGAPAYRSLGCSAATRARQTEGSGRRAAGRHRLLGCGGSPSTVHSPVRTRVLRGQRRVPRRGALQGRFGWRKGFQKRLPPGGRRATRRPTLPATRLDVVRRRPSAHASRADPSSTPPSGE